MLSNFLRNVRIHWLLHVYMVIVLSARQTLRWVIFKSVITERGVLGPDFQNFLRRFSEDLRKMTELTEILGKSYDNADFQNFLRKS